MIPLASQVSLTGVPRRVRHLKFTERSAKLPPMIKLGGQWLVDAGFTPGQRVEVAITGSGELIIRRQQVTSIEAERQSLIAQFDKVMQATAPARAEVAA
jgi:hypothetical protein